MAESDPIKHSDIIEPGLFDNTIKSGEDLLRVLDQMEEQFKKVAAAAGKDLRNALPDSVAGLQKISELTKQIDQSEAALNETSKQKILIAERMKQLRVEEFKQKEDIRKQNRAEAQAEKERVKRAKEMESAYGALSVKYREAAKLAKDLAAAHGIESKAAKQAAETARKYNDQLKAIDASIGNHQRNVGNYASAVQGLTGALGTLGITVGVGALVSGMRESVAAFLEAEKSAKQLAFAVESIGGGQIAINTLIEQADKLEKAFGFYTAEDIQDNVQRTLINFGLTTEAVEDLTPAILDLAAATGMDLASATDVVTNGINGKMKGLKKLGIEIVDTGNKTENYNQILDKLAKFQGAAAAAGETHEGKIRRLEIVWEDFQESIGEFLVNQGSELLDYFDVLTGKISASDLAMKQLRDTLGFDERTNEFLKTIQDKSTADQLAAINAELAKLRNERRRLNAAYDSGQLSAGLFAASAQEVDQQIDLLNKEFEALLKNNGKVIAAQEEKEEKVNKKAKEKSEERIQQAQEEMFAYETIYGTIYLKYADLQKRMTEDAKAEADMRAQYEQKLQDQRAKDRENFEKKTGITATGLSPEEFQKQADNDIQMFEDYYNRGIISWSEYQKALNDIAEKAAQERRMAQAKEVGDTIKFQEQILKAIEDSARRRLDLTQQELQRRESLIDSSMQTQTELFSRGLKNTLDFEEKAKAENLRKQAEIDRRRARQEQVQQLTSAYFEFLKLYAKQGDVNAAAKALAQTLAAQGIALAFGGNFAEGVENFKGKGTGTSDSNIIGFSNGESVVTAQGTRETAGLVSAINEKGFDGAKAWAMDNIFMPELKASMRVSESPKGWETMQVVRELQEVKEVIKNKKEVEIGWNQMGEMVRRETQAGITRLITTKKRRF